MSPNSRNKKPVVSIVGPGNVGRVMALALVEAGYRLDEVIVRDRASSESRRRAAALAKRVKGRVADLASANLTADVIWICVPDDAIRQVTSELAKKSKTAWKGKVVLHASGALTSSELKGLKKKGAAVGSLHPMNTFVKGSGHDLRRVPFAVEGDAAAAKVASAMARDMGGNAFRLNPKAKVLYHALGSFSSPLLISLLNVAERTGKKAGIADPRTVMSRILRQSLENYLAQGSAAAFSGPIRRGDLKTVGNHLKQLRQVPFALEVYKALAKNAAENLPVKDRNKLKRLLRG